VTKACRYDPDLNPTYQEMAIHYGVGVVPARPYKPRDKAKVESNVLLAETLDHGSAALSEILFNRGTEPSHPRAP
jgi:transposase